MGRVTAAVAQAGGQCRAVAGIDAGQPEELGFPIYRSPEECTADADALIDFSTAAAVPGLLNWNSRRKIPMVICTTGLSESCLANMKALSLEVPIFHSANMSLGVNVMLELLRKAAKLLEPLGYDVEIIEKHHSQKTDAPSGTALMMADAVNIGGVYTYTTDRSQRRGKRPEHEIGISSVRGGTIVGEHTVLFAGPDEVLEFTHTAQSREVFAAGALKAAQFIAAQPAGMYGMGDLFNAI
jgi:4-hydroxy-tetrahydrodipicolinate reductase